MTDSGWDVIHQPAHALLASKLAQALETQLEVQRSPCGSRHFLWQREDKTLGVETWPFEDDEFSVDVEVHKSITFWH
jgi:hypothetical protein